MGDGGQDKYKAAFDLLAEDGQDKIRVARFMDFVKTAFGSAYDDETITLLTDALQPDNNGYLDFQGFMKLFSGERLSPEVRKEMYRVFSGGAEGLASMADWSGALSRLGLQLSDEAVSQVMKEAAKSALELLQTDTIGGGGDSEEESGDENEIEKRKLKEKEKLHEKVNEEKKLNDEEKDNEKAKGINEPPEETIKIGDSKAGGDDDDPELQEVD